MLKNYRKALRVKDESDLGLNRRNKSFTRLSSIKSKQVIKLIIVSWHAMLLNYVLKRQLSFNGQQLPFYSFSINNK